MYTINHREVLILHDRLCLDGAAQALDALAESAGFVSAQTLHAGLRADGSPIGLATVSIASFVIAGITRMSVGSQADDARATGGCAPNCTSAQRDDWSGKLVQTNVLLGVGIGTAVLAAASWFVLAPKRPARTTALAYPTLTW